MSEKPPNDNKILIFPNLLGRGRSVEACLGSAALEGLENVVVFGVEANGQIYFDTTVPTDAEVNLLLDRIKNFIVGFPL